MEICGRDLQYQMFWRSNWNREDRHFCARRSDMKDAEDVLSSRARALTEVPSGALTKMRQVMSNEFDLRPMAVLEDIISS